MTTSVIGFPRFGEFRELKKATTRYFKQKISQEELLEAAKQLRAKHWRLQQEKGIDWIPSNDFSFFDTTLDTAVLLNIIPERVKALGLDELDTYFALARGYQGEHGDSKALPLKKWFNTNYHYIVPEISKETKVQLSGHKIFDEYEEAKALGIETKPVLVGPYTLLALSDIAADVDREQLHADLSAAYREILAQLATRGAEWVQLDEPALVFDLSEEDIARFSALYRPLLDTDADIKVLLQTYFGDVRDIYDTLIELPFAGIGLDFIEGEQNQALVNSGFPADKTLFAGVVNGRNIWRNHYRETLALLNDLSADHIVLSTSSSLLHVPYTVENEHFAPAISRHFAFAKEKLDELKELETLFNGADDALLEQNDALFAGTRYETNPAVTERVNNLTEDDFHRKDSFAAREAAQKEAFDLPLFPTTTIGSFPQTADVRKNRKKFRHGEITQAEYDQFNKDKIAETIKYQEDIGLDVLVHGEFERSDMVEYFAEHFDGFLFTENAWVQSYGTRGVKPPIIWGDVSRNEAVTVPWSTYAQSLTDHPVKGMLTGPVTILNWSFPREDISHKEATLQIALALQDEVNDLEAHGIHVIQIDEPAFREGLPLRRSDWHSKYLDWAVPAFRLSNSQVQATTQIHTHMCYSEFTDILDAIDALDADVISFEASRSNLEILDALKAIHFHTHVGPGVYDIHSPRIPSEAEIATEIHDIADKLPLDHIWINPDCGLKTRQVDEATASLQHIVAAAKQAREAVHG